MIDAYSFTDFNVVANSRSWFRYYKSKKEPVVQLNTFFLYKVSQDCIQKRVFVLVFWIWIPANMAEKNFTYNM